MTDSCDDDDDCWWWLDGTVDWATNPAGQTIELSFDGVQWTVSVWTPFAPTREAIVIRTVCGDRARLLYGRLAVLDAPAPAAALDRWLREESRYRPIDGRGDHPAGGGT